MVLSEGAAANGEPEQTDEGEGKVAAEDQRLEERRAIIKSRTTSETRSAAKGTVNLYFRGK